MTVLQEGPPPTVAVSASDARPGLLERWSGPAWPLKAMLLGFPLWWALGLASFVVLLSAVGMVVQIRRRGLPRLPAGLPLLLLFIAWMLAGGFLLWAEAPGTISEGGPERLVPFAYRVLWYLAVTVAVLYPLSLPSSVLPLEAVARWLGTLFLVCVAGGLAGLAAPAFEFTSPMELLLPGAGNDTGFLNALVHPSLTTQSDFLGYVQPRPKAPFTYANAWGNNVGLLLPFFVYGWVTHEQRWRRYAIAPVLALAAVPIAFSLNRGLWLGLCVLAVGGAVSLARTGRYAAVWALTLGLLVATVALVASPLWQTISLRLDTPHSNDRRATVAQVVPQTTLQGSPLLGYGTTRKVEGSFDSIAGGGSPECRQCAAPPLGTQGFLWRLVFTTGFIGTGLFLGFLATNFVRHVGRREPACVLGCLTLVTSGLFFLVYDSLELPLFVLMLSVGLMNRARFEAGPPALPDGSDRSGEVSRATA